LHALVLHENRLLWLSDSPLHSGPVSGVEAPFRLKHHKARATEHI